MPLVKVSLTTLKPLHIIGKYLGIWPSFNPNTMAKCGRCYIYGVLALALILFDHIYSFLGKFEMRDKIDRSLFVTLVLSDFATTATNLSAIININFLQGNRLHRFLEKLQELETMFRNVQRDERTEARAFYVELAIGHLLYVVYLVYNTWQWTSKLGWHIGQYALLRDFQFYHIFISVLLIRNYVLMINCKLQGVNYVLQQQASRFTNSNDVKNDVSGQGSRDNILPTGDNLFAIATSTACRILSNNRCNHEILDIKDEWNLECISKVYTKLANVINDFNEIFGWNLVVYQIQLIANLLFPLNLALVYGNGETVKGTKFDFHLYILCCIWIIIPLTHILTIISACDRAKREASRIPTICYNLMLETDDDEIITKLKNLALQGHLQAPEFSAAGFFNFNYSLVFPTITSIISYFIVLVQFNT